MSTDTKDSRNSPGGSSRTKKRVKEPSLTSTSNSTRSLTGFDLGKEMTASMKNEDIKKIISIQNKSLKNFAKTNELLGKFNDFSSSKYDVLQHMFFQHTRLLVDLKKGLSSIFLRIRHLKLKLQKQYPEAFEATFNLRQDLEHRLEQEDASKPTYVSNPEDKEVNKARETAKIADGDKGMVEINNVLTVETYQNLPNELGKTNNDLGCDEASETYSPAESCATYKKGYSVDNENCAVINHKDVLRESDQEGPKDEAICDSSNCLQTNVMSEGDDDDSFHVEGKSNINMHKGDQDNDVHEGVKMATEGIQDCLVIDGSMEDKR